MSSMNRDTIINNILGLVPPAEENFTEERARKYLLSLGHRKLKRELNSARKYVTAPERRAARTEH